MVNKIMLSFAGRQTWEALTLDFGICIGGGDMHSSHATFWRDLVFCERAERHGDLLHYFLACSRI